jgi:hypothetical protein
MTLARSFKAGISRQSQPVVASATIEYQEGSLTMANTYTSLHYHIIFSTKNREPWLVRDIEQRVWAFVGGIARAHNMLLCR